MVKIVIHKNHLPYLGMTPAETQGTLKAELQTAVEIRIFNYQIDYDMAIQDTGGLVWETDGRTVFTI